MFRKLLLSCSLFLGLFLVIQKTDARTILVTTTNDELDSSTDCITNKSDCSLREAIALANTDTSANQDIFLPAGTYKLNIDNGSVVTEQENISGDLNINNSSVVVRLIGVGSSSTIIDANGSVLQDRAIGIGEGANVFISKMTIKNGYLPDSPLYYGGGIYCSKGSSLQLSNTILSGNEAPNGAAIYVDGANSVKINLSSFFNNTAATAIIYGSTTDIEVTNSKISNNDAFIGLYVDNTANISSSEFLNNSDTAIYNDGGNLTVANNTMVSSNGDTGIYQLAGTLNIINSKINKNNSAGLDIQDGNIAIYNSIFDNNIDYGIYIQCETVGANIISSSLIQNSKYGITILVPDTTVTNITNTDVLNNSQNGLVFQGIGSLENVKFKENVGTFGAVINDGVLQINNSTFENNEQTDSFWPGSGALYNDTSSSAVITNSYFGNNKSVNDGGAIINKGNMKITNATFYNNSATENGGAIMNSGTIYLTFNTINANTSSETAGGVYSATGSNTNIKNSILSNNLDVSGSVVNCAGSVSSGGYNLEDEDTCSFISTGDLVDTAPGLSAAGAAANGGLTKTIALMTGSIAIDDIPIDYCVDFDGSLISNDQRNFIRPKKVSHNNYFCDIGAFEVQNRLF